MTRAQRILYVDDDPACRRAFARAMRQSGFIVDVAESGEEALTLARRYPYAVLAVDLYMPNVDGAKLVASVRDDAHNPACILVTGAAESDLDNLDLLGLGIRYVTRKPWHADSLAAQLRAAMTEHAAAHTAQSVRATDPSSTQLRALVLDSERERGARTANLLSSNPRAQFEVEHVATLVDAAEALEQEAADVVLVSLDDALDNSETIARILGSQPSAPIVTLSPAADDSLSLLAIQAGAQDFMLHHEVESGLLIRSIQHAIVRKRSEDLLAHIAHHDQLTGLANRKLLGQRVAQAVARARRRGTKVAVFFLDLDRFKSVNDTLGHDAGDELLQEVAHRLVGSVRTTDTVARLGGDEFAIVLEELERAEEATLLAGRVLNAFATPFRLKAGEVVTTTSIGIAMFPHNGEAAEDLLKCADSAMYRAKQTGRDNYQFFSEALHAQAVRQIELESSLRDAVENEEFVVYFQPQVNATTLAPVGMEALVRWQRPDGRLVAPREFMHILEDTGLIVPLGEWVLRQACAQVKAWNTSGHLNLRVAVNVSGRQFEARSFSRAIEDALSAYGLEGHQLELEITETVLMQDTARTRTTFEQLRELGVRIAIDDFGTGYSSLAYLKSFPIDALKVDRSFLQGLGESGEGETLILASAVMALGRSLGLDVVAEGIETARQLAFVEAQRCPLLQGYLVGRPQHAAATTRWLQEVLRNDGRAKLAPEPARPAAMVSTNRRRVLLTD